MDEPTNRTPGLPARLLLASDLSARCDRALDRAARLAADWRAELVVLNVVEAPQTPDLALAWAAGGDDAPVLDHARRQLRDDVAALGVRAELRVVRGDAADAIREQAAAAGSDLVVTGMARDEPFGRFLVGTTVERLARTLTQPLLVVRSRVRGPYRRVVVATDFSDASRDALHAAVALFAASAELTLYHARPPHAGEALEPAAVAPDDAARRECAAFLDASGLAPGVRARLRVAIERGALETALTRHVREHGVDLVVAGTRGRSGMLDLLLGSAAARLVDWLPCDTMIVRRRAAG